MEMGAGGRGRGTAISVGGCGGNIDPSNLHLKKELTLMARVLRDPGTSSSWRSPHNSARSLAKHHHVRQHKKGQIAGNTVAPSSEQFLQPPLQVQSNGNNYTSGNGDGDKDDVNGKEKGGRVLLYNWGRQKSESERSKQIGEEDVENGKGESWISSQDDVSEDVGSLSDGRNGGGNDSKSDSYLSEKYHSLMFNCKDTNFAPSIRRTAKKKLKRINCSSADLKHDNGRLQKQIMISRGGKNVVKGLSLGREELVSLVDQSDDTEDYCYSEDLRRESPASSLLTRLKNKGWTNSSTKLLRSHRKEDDTVSHGTPALSTSSIYKYGVKNPSGTESWDAATGSFNDADDEVDSQLDLPGRHGCGIPCCWSRRSTPRSRLVYGSSCSPSLSDTLRRKGSIIFCGSQSMHRRRHHGSSLGSHRRRLNGQYLVPLLTNNGHDQGGCSMGSGNSDDELSANFGELDLEALSRLDGRRWSSSCRSQDGVELLAMNGEVHEECSPENIRSLSHKYRPMFFEELIGQNIVGQFLMSAISRGRIAPIYLFQGPRGTGKTSMARIFAAALNCLATEETKPCGVCRECGDFISGKSSYLREFDGSNKKGIDNINNLLKSLSEVHPSALPQFKIFVVDECHLLPSKTWLTFLRVLEKPLPHVVFILTTTDIDNVPRNILSRCQRHIFSKISNVDIVTRLRKIATDENLDVDSDALELIALNADGSLRDAETMLDQLSLFGKRITISLVNELVGVVSDEMLLDLLELAMSSNASETVIKARELMDSGIDPIVLMSQMATLIVDIIGGTYPHVDGKRDSLFGGRSLSARELDRLKHALTLLSEAEKHLRGSSERSTWFTATLLQLGSMPSPDRTSSVSSQRQSIKAVEEEHMFMFREATAPKQKIDAQLATEKSGSPKSFQRSSQSNSTSKDNLVSQANAATSDSNLTRRGETLTVSQDDCKSGRNALRCENSNTLNNIWLQCIEKCHSNTLRQLLHSHGRLVSISEVKGGIVAHVAFGDRNIKTRAEGFLSSITNSFEIVLRRNVEVKIILSLVSLGQRQTEETIGMNLENRSMCSNVAVSNSDLDLRKEPVKVSGGSFNVPGGHHSVPSESVVRNVGKNPSVESKTDIPVKRMDSNIRGQRLETAWLQAAEKGTSGSISRLKPEKNQVMPQDGTYPPNELAPVKSVDVPPRHWEDELNREIEALKINDGTALQKDQIACRINHSPISPSLLHSRSIAGNFSKDNTEYESGPGTPACSGMFCWSQSRRPTRVKAKQGSPLHSHKGGGCLWFGECAKSRMIENKKTQ